MSYTMSGNLILTCDTPTQVILALSPDCLIGKLDKHSQSVVRAYIEHYPGTILDKILGGMDFKVIEQTASPKTGLYQVNLSLIASNVKSFDPFLSYLASIGFGIKGKLRTNTQGKEWKYSARLGSKQLKCKVKEPKTKRRTNKIFEFIPMTEITQCKFCGEEMVTYT